jgi:hypothetical protein
LQDPAFAPHINDFIADAHTTHSFMYNKNKNITHSL